jgi:alkaline phosphatase D
MIYLKSAMLVASLLPLIGSAQELRFAMGSCAELRDPEREQIFSSIEKKNPDFFFWLGDNTYYTSGEWNDSTLMAENWKRRLSSPPLANMIKAIPQRAIWDDHDFGPNDADSTYALREVSAHIFTSIFKDTPYQYARYGDLRWSERRGAAHFIALDDRTHRGPIGTQILGKGQLEWLSTELETHRDAKVIFVAVGSQVLNLAESFENMVRYPEERLALLDRCSAYNGTLVFLTGDRHHGEVEELVHRGKRFVEVCSSPLTSKVFPPRSPETEINTTIVGSPVNQEHFTVITLKQSKLFVEYFTTKGQTIVNVVYDL